MKIKVVSSVMTPEEAAKFAPMEAELQDELNTALKKTVEKFFDSHMDQGPQIMGTALSCLLCATVALAKTLEMSEVEARTVFHQVVKHAGLKNVIH